MPDQPTPTEVSIKGRFVGMSILGSAVILVIFLENLRVTAWLPYVLYILAGALALAIAIPMLFFRRPVDGARRA
jgi:tellurite resistance protein TehA-like permease